MKELNLKIGEKYTILKTDELVPLSVDYIQNNNIKPVEAPTNENYISYIKTLLTQYNVNDLLNYIKIEGYSLYEYNLYIDRISN